MKVTKQLKVRRNWGDLKPVTKIKNSSKLYKRNQKYRYVGWGDLS